MLWFDLRINKFLFAFFSKAHAVELVFYCKFFPLIYGFLPSSIVCPAKFMLYFLNQIRDCIFLDCILYFNILFYNGTDIT